MEIKDMKIEEVEARTLEIQAEVDSADEARMAELKTELDALEERKTELKKMAAENQQIRLQIAEGTAIIEEVKDVIEEERKMTNKEVCATKEYRDAFANYIRTGDDKECRALLTENVSGDVPVASIVYDIVKNAWEKEGIVARIKKAYVKGNLRVGFEISADGAFIHTEGQAVSSSAAENLVLGTVNIVASNIKKFIDESFELCNSPKFTADDIINHTEMLQNQIDLFHAFTRDVQRKFPKGYISAVRTPITAFCNELDKYFSIEGFINQYKILEQLNLLLDDFLQQVNTSKRISGNLSFYDVSELALKFLLENEDIRNQEKHQTREKSERTLNTVRHTSRHLSTILL